MKKFFKKNKASKGFTLAELLIVVAIIAVLAIIAIPIFSAKLENSREETDIANLRSAKAAAVSQYLSGTDLDGAAITSTGFTCYFDAVSGELVSSSTGVSGYGRGTASEGGCEAVNLVVNPASTTTKEQYTKTSAVAGQIIKLTIDDSGQIIMEWTDATKS